MLLKIIGTCRMEGMEVVPDNVFRQRVVFLCSLSNVRV
jgi:hypothetical protein